MKHSTATCGEWRPLNITELEHFLHHRTFSWAVCFWRVPLAAVLKTERRRAWRQQEERRGGYWRQMVASGTRASRGRGQWPDCREIQGISHERLLTAWMWSYGSVRQKSSIMNQPDFVNHHLITLRNGGHRVVAEWDLHLGCSTKNKENVSPDIFPPFLK